MKKLLFSFILVLVSISGFCATVVISNVGFAFSPASVTINAGDDVLFTITAFDAWEVSEATWNAEGNTPLPLGFHTPVGGRLVTSSELAIGTHYYICPAQITVMHMKGVIIVQTPTAVEKNKSFHDLIVYPNPAYSILTVKNPNNQRSLKYLVMDNSGKKVLTGDITGEIEQFDISSLPKGIYYIQMVGDRRRSAKFIRK